MSSYINKAIALGPYAYPDAKQNFFTSYQDFTDTNTPFVRLWVQPNRLQPASGSTNPATDQYVYKDWNVMVKDYVAGLDAQIALARSQGRNVVLTFDGYYPQWMNGVVGYNNPRYPPADVSISSGWAQLLYWCAARWSYQNPNNNGAYVNVIEIVNEPNLFADRPDGQSSSLPLYNEDFTYLTAQMMKTAEQIQTNAGLYTPVFAGPCVADHGASTKRDYSQFTDYVLFWLSGMNFKALTTAGNAGFVWTQHNYEDLEGGGPGYTRQQNMRATMKNYGWRGYPSASSTPYVLITEGGVRKGNGPNGGSGNDMSARTVAVYNAIHNDTASVGEGLGMMTNYLVISDPNRFGDCGLREYNSPFPKRPLWTGWKNLVA